MEGLSVFRQLWAGLQQRVYDGLHFPLQNNRPTHSRPVSTAWRQQKVLIKGRTRFRNYRKTGCSWTIRCLGGKQQQKTTWNAEGWIRWQAVAALVSEAHDVLMFHMQTAKLNQSSSVSYSESFHRSRTFPPDSDMDVEKANKQANQEISFWEKLILKEAASGVGISDASYWTLFTFWSLED